MNLCEFDLNLLVAFDAIYKERNLTHAGHRLHLTQSAMSHALGRLRTVFDDPLFVRQGNHMVTTPLAEDMAVNIQQVLKLLEITLEDRGRFDPQRSESTFCIGLGDYTAFVLLPELLKILKPVAPKIHIKARHLTFEQRAASLDNGSADLVIGCEQVFGASIYQQVLFREREVCILSKDHPDIGDTLSFDQYINAEFIRLSLADYREDPIDEELAEKGVKRKVMIMTEHELTIPKLVSSTNYIANIAERLGKKFLEWLPVKILPVPLDNTRFKIHQYWHKRNQIDPAHKWLRRSIKQVCEKI
ncbi:MAG: LysR family transcriptional regulator [Desulfobacterales bacterium]|nr:LysR family transcriptional regulator [Desulfobacterales bacterium]